MFDFCGIDAELATSASCGRPQLRLYWPALPVMSNSGQEAIGVRMAAAIHLVNIRWVGS